MSCFLCSRTWIGWVLKIRSSYLLLYMLSASDGVVSTSLSSWGKGWKSIALPCLASLRTSLALRRCSSSVYWVYKWYYLIFLRCQLHIWSGYFFVEIIRIFSWRNSKSSSVCFLSCFYCISVITSLVESGANLKCGGGGEKEQDWKRGRWER